MEARTARKYSSVFGARLKLVRLSASCKQPPNPLASFFIRSYAPGRKLSLPA